MEKQQTAMQTILNEMNCILGLMDDPTSELDFRHCIETLKTNTIELLQLEKEQIVKAVDDALEDRSLYESFQTLKSGEQYFNETFTTQHSESLNKLKEQLEKWISDCEIQAERFVKDNHEVSYLSSKAMAQAYRNALELINTKP